MVATKPRSFFQVRPGLRLKGDYLRVRTTRTASSSKTLVPMLHLGFPSSNRKAPCLVGTVGQPLEVDSTGGARSHRRPWTLDACPSAWPRLRPSLGTARTA